MNYNHLSLKQKGMNAVRIFPIPPIKKQVDQGTMKDPTQYGFEKDNNDYTYHKKIQSNNVVIGYQVLDKNTVLQAQSCEEYLNQAVRSLNYDNRAIIQNLGKLSLLYSKKI